MADISIEIAGRPVNLSERDIARFWSKVDKSDPGGCWPWTGSTNGAKRGVMLLARRPMYAPQLSLVIAGKPRPPKPFNNALHGDECVSPLCVRPDHLRWGTHKENTADAVRLGRWVQVGKWKLTPEQVRFALSSPMTNVAVAREICCSRERVRQLRATKK